MVGAKGFEPSTFLVPNQVLKSHKRFIWRRLRDEKRYFPLLVVRNLYLKFWQLQLQALEG
jgi:hypothetical protein